MADIEAQARETLLAELADEHGCIDADERGNVLGCEDCAGRAVRLAARLEHEALLASAWLMVLAAPASSSPEHTSGEGAGS